MLLDHDQVLVLTNKQKSQLIDQTLKQKAQHRLYKRCEDESKYEGMPKEMMRDVYQECKRRR